MCSLFFLTHPPQNNPDQASFLPFLFRGAEALSGVGHRDRPGRRHPVSQNIRVHTTTQTMRGLATLASEMMTLCIERRS